MKHSMQVAGIMVLAGLNVQAARDSRPADVTVYVQGADLPPNPVHYEATRTVTWMYARIGVRLDWRIGNAAGGAVSGSPVAIQMRYGSENERPSSPDSLAFALPFADGTTAITVMYARIQFLTDRSACRGAILAHVLAHEIGHVLQRIDRHALTGVMKAHWNGRDYDAMEKKLLEFTPDDIDLIVRGLAARKARVASEHGGDAIVRPAVNGRK
jgi:hypothetical protein